MLKKINRLKLILFATIFMCISTYAEAVDCIVDNSKVGWNGSITFHTDQDVDLAKNPIQFELTNNAVVSSIWGIDGKSAFSQSEATVNVNISKWWPEGAGYILQAGKSVTLSFSSSTNDYSIENFRIGNSSSHGTVVLKKDKDSDPIPANAVVKLTPEQGRSGKSYIFKWSESNSHPVEYGDYKISAYIDNTKLNNSIEDISVYPPDIFLDETESSVTLLLTYSQNKYSINLELNADKPEGGTNTLPVNVVNNDTQASVTVNVPWNGKKAFTTATPGIYSFSALPIMGADITKFVYNPKSVAIEQQGESVPVSITSYTEPLTVRSVTMHISGLPQGTPVTLHFNNSYTPVTQTGITYGFVFDINEGNYILTSNPVKIGNNTYLAKKQSVSITSSTRVLNLVFSKLSPVKSVKGWPNYVTMGTITGASLKGHEVDEIKDRIKNWPDNINAFSIFTYSGQGGSETWNLNYFDKMIKDPKISNLYKLTSSLENDTNKKINPVVVVYTCGSSGGADAIGWDLGIHSDPGKYKVMNDTNMRVPSEAGTNKLANPT
jgi:hypothetical protein